MADAPIPAWARDKPGDHESPADSGSVEPGSVEPGSVEPSSVEPSSVEPSPAWQELDEPHRPDPVQVWFQDEALAVPEAEVEPPAVEDEIPLGEPAPDTAATDDADETAVEQTSSRELAKHRRAGLVAERRAAKAERRQRRAEARLLRRRGADRVSAPLETDDGDEQALPEGDVLAAQEQQAEAERAEAERAEAERVEAERIEAERVEAERVEAERVEAERVEAERVEQERRDAEEREEADRQAALAAEQEAETAREAEREAAEREAEEQRLAEQAEAERLETEQAELEAAAEAARAKAEQAEQRERERQAKEAEREQARQAKEAEREQARQAKEAEREQAREAKEAERERRRAEKAERRAEKARAAAERRRDPAPDTDAAGTDAAADDALDDVPEPPDEVGSGRSATPRRSRNVVALVAGTIGALGLLFSVLLAVGAFLVAVGTDDSGTLFSALATFCDAVTAPIGGLFSFSGEDAEKQEALVTWGLGALIYLAIGLAAQNVLGSRTETADA